MVEQVPRCPPFQCSLLHPRALLTGTTGKARPQPALPPTAQHSVSHARPHTRARTWE